MEVPEPLWNVAGYLPETGSLVLAIELSSLRSFERLARVPSNRPSFDVS